MNARWHLQLVHDLHMKSVILFWRIPVRAIGLLDSDNGYFFAQDFEWNLLSRRAARALKRRPLHSQLENTRLLVRVSC